MSVRVGKGYKEKQMLDILFERNPQLFGKWCAKPESQELDMSS